MNDVRSRLERVFRKVFDDKRLTISDGMTANDLEEWDSFMHITLIVAIEQEFSVKFSVGELTGLANVGDTIRLIEKKLKR